jgi:hypothetical protein
VEIGSKRFEGVYDIMVSSAETIGAFNAGFGAIVESSS